MQLRIAYIMNSLFFNMYEKTWPDSSPIFIMGILTTFTQKIGCFKKHAPTRDTVILKVLKHEIFVTELYTLNDPSG